MGFLALVLFLVGCAAALAVEEPLDFSVYLRGSPSMMTFGSSFTVTALFAQEAKGFSESYVQISPSTVTFSLIKDTDVTYRIVTSNIDTFDPVTVSIEARPGCWEGTNRTFHTASR